jgi:hypothetical protein
MRWCACLFTLSAAIASGQTVPDSLVPADEPTVITGLPASPSGRSTVMGGQIQRVDLVRDQFALKIPGGKPVQILFDERTQLYQDGRKISVLKLQNEDHASIETTLDGTAIFALRIHVLSDPPDGQLQGQVISYNPATGELKLRVTASTNAVTLIAVQNTPVGRVGEGVFVEQKPGSADLVHGTLLDVTFKAGKNGPGLAKHIDVLAVPGAEFVLRGSVSSLDLRAGRMSIANPSGDNPTDVTFKPSRFEASHDLRQGSSVKVTALFDGTHYVASDISIE